MHMSIKPYTKDLFDPKDKKILFISAHPDDADFIAGGTILHWLDSGARAALVVATNGDKGTGDRTLTSTQLATIRHTEQLEASKKLGLDETWFLDYEDAHLAVSHELKNKLVRIIRLYKPDAIFTFDPAMIYSLRYQYINHPDHRAIGQAALDALFPMARDFLTFPEHGAEGLEPHNVTDVFLYNFDQPTIAVDISQTIERKLELLAIHASQVNLETVEPDVRAESSQIGQLINVPYAEGFVHLKISC